MPAACFLFSVTLCLFIGNLLDNKLHFPVPYTCALPVLVFYASNTYLKKRFNLKENIMWFSLNFLPPAVALLVLAAFLLTYTPPSTEDSLSLYLHSVIGFVFIISSSVLFSQRSSTTTSS